MRPILIITVLSILFSSGSHADTSQADFLAQNGLKGQSVEQMVDTIDQTPQSRPLPYKASVTSKSLILTADQKTYEYPLGDKFYLSFSPWQSQTHPCENHSLSGCTGEMPNTQFDVKITNSDGAVVVQQPMQSYQNGFIGVWLPREMKGTIEVSYKGKRATAPVNTFTDSPTCMTTLKLI